MPNRKEETRGRRPLNGTPSEHAPSVPPRRDFIEGSMAPRKTSPVPSSPEAAPPSVWLLTWNGHAPMLTPVSFVPQYSRGAIPGPR